MTSPFSVSAADNLNYFSFASSAQRKVFLTFGLLRPPGGQHESKEVYLVRRADGVNDNQFALSAPRTK